MSEIAGKVIIVTGAGGAIGGATASHLAQAGAKIAYVDIRQPENMPDDAIFLPADVSDEDQVAAMVAKTVQHFGRLDGAFNNAGVEQSGKAFLDIDVADWQRVMQINAAGMFFCLKHELGALSDHGSIVNTASSLGQVAVPMAAEYIASKHAVIGLTRAAAVEFAASGKRVNAILPGAVNTEMFKRRYGTPDMLPVADMIRRSHPMQRLGEAHEFAGTVKWLLSSDSSFVTGATIAVDGGFTAA